MLADDVVAAVQSLVKDSSNVKTVRVKVLEKKKVSFASVEFDCVKPPPRNCDWETGCGLFVLLGVIFILLFLAVFKVPRCLWEKVETENTSVAITNRCSGAMLNMSFEMKKTKTLDRE